MLVRENEQYLKAAFESETELEGVVQKYAEQLFGSSIVFLSQARIKTLGGRGTVPDAIVIDVEAREWYVVEAERGVHGTWEHIAPQVSRQLAAVGSSQTREAIVQLALAQIRDSMPLREVFRDLGILELEIHGRLQETLNARPIIAIPIDDIPNDLTEWAQTLRNDVRIWLVEKFVSVSDPSRILYSLPDDNLPTVSTTSSGTGAVSTVRMTGSQPWQELIAAMPELVGTPVFMEYGPRGSQRRSFEGMIRKGGVEVAGELYSPSYAAVRCMQNAGGKRTTANGWMWWRIASGERLSDLYQNLEINRSVEITNKETPLTPPANG